MRHGRPITIPEHRKAPSGMYRHSVPDPAKEFGRVWTDHTRAELDRIFDLDPEANVYDENGRRVDATGTPIGHAG